MDLFFILFLIFIAIMVVGYLGRGIAGKIGCLVFFIIFIVWFAIELHDEISKQEEQEKIDKKKGEDAVEEIRRTKQMYIDSGWVKPPKM